MDSYDRLKQQKDEIVARQRSKIEVERDALKAERDSLLLKLGSVRDVIYEQFSKGKCSELVAVGLIEKIVREDR